MSISEKFLFSMTSVIVLYCGDDRGVRVYEKAAGARKASERCGGEREAETAGGVEAGETATSDCHEATGGQRPRIHVVSKDLKLTDFSSIEATRSRSSSVSTDASWCSSVR